MSGAKFLDLEKSEFEGVRKDWQDEVQRSLAGIRDQERVSCATSGMAWCFYTCPTKCRASRLGINSCVQLATDPALH